MRKGATPSPNVSAVATPGEAASASQGGGITDVGSDSLCIDTELLRVTSYLVAGSGFVAAAEAPHPPHVF